MKEDCNSSLRLPALLLAGLLACAGCSKSKPVSAQEQNTGPVGTEISKVEKAFASADASLRFPLEEALRVVKAAGYADVLPNLRKLAANAQATPEQKQALEELIQKLEGLPAQAAPR